MPIILVNAEIETVARQFYRLASAVRAKMVEPDDEKQRTAAVKLLIALVIVLLLAGLLAVLVFGLKQRVRSRRDGRY